MRSRQNMIPMLAAAAMASLAGPAFLGAQAKLPVPVIPDLSSSAGKNGRKHRNSGAGSKRPKWGNNAGARPHCGAKQAAKYARQGHGINYHFEQRMRWNDTVYPRVLEHQARQRAQSLLMAAA